MFLVFASPRRSSSDEDDGKEGVVWDRKANQKGREWNQVVGVGSRFGVSGCSKRATSRPTTGGCGASLVREEGGGRREGRSGEGRRGGEEEGFGSLESLGSLGPYTKDHFLKYQKV